MAYTFTRTGAQIEEIHNTVEDPKGNTQFSDDIRTIAGEYRGLWPDTGGSANKGDTYQTQVSGTGTGQFFTALQNTTDDPVGDDVNWKVNISASNVRNPNLLSNGQFKIASPDNSLPAPSATPQDYPAGFQIFSGWFVDDVNGASGVTRVNDTLNWTKDGVSSIYTLVPKDGDLTEYTASLAGKVSGAITAPDASHVSFSDNGDGNWRITIANSATDIYSCKFEQGSVATGHEVFGWSQLQAWRDDGDVRGWGATDNSDSTEEILSAMQGVYPKEYQMETLLTITEQVNTISPAVYTTNESEQSLFSFVSQSGEQKIKSPKFIGWAINQPQLDSRSNNNHSSLKFSAIDDVDIKNTDCVLDIFSSLGYGYTAAGTTATEASDYANISLNRVRFSGLGSEIIGGSQSVQVGNHLIGSKPGGGKATSHAFRLAGYDGARATYNAHVGNFAFNCNTAFSYQQTARYNSAFGNVIRFTSDAVQFPSHTDTEGNNLSSYQPRYNQNYGVVSNSDKTVYMEGASYNDMNHVGVHNSTEAVVITTDSVNGDSSLGNSLGGILYDCDSQGVVISAECDYQRLNYSLFNGRGRPFNIASDFNVGVILAKDWDSQAFLSGDFNVLNLQLIDVGASDDSITISGNNNTITLNTNKGVLVSGDNNKFIGRIAGVVSDTGSGNDFSAVTTFTDRGKTTVNTDANGYLDIPHDIGSYYLATALLHGDDGRYCTTFATNPNALKLRCYDSSGSPLASTSVQVSWRCETGYA